MPRGTIARTRFRDSATEAAATADINAIAQRHRQLAELVREGGALKADENQLGTLEERRIKFAGPSDAEQLAGAQGRHVENPRAADELLCDDCGEVPAREQMGAS